MITLTRLRPSLNYCRFFSSSLNNNIDGAAEAFPLKSLYMNEMLRKSPWYDEEMKNWKEAQA